MKYVWGIPPPFWGMFPCATARWLRTKDPMGSKCDEDGTRDPLGFTRAPASFAHCDQGRTRFFARGMIARVVRLPAFVSGLKNELAQRFCCRCPACDPSTRRLPRLRSQPSSRCRRFVTSISCHPDAFLQRRCSTSSSSCFCCGRAPLPACAVPWLPRHALLHF